MNHETQTFLFMLVSTLKSGEHNFLTYLPVLIMLIPFIQNLIQVNAVCKYLFYYKSQYFEYSIQSHDVPVIKNYTSVPLMRIQFSDKFLAVSHYINKTITKHNFCSVVEIMSYNAELFFFSDVNEEKTGKKYIDLPLNNEMTMIYDDIYCQYKFDKIEAADSERSDSSSLKKVNRNSHYIITLSIKRSKDNYTVKMNDFIDHCVSEYEKYLSSTKKKYDNKPYIYSYLHFEKVDTKVELHFNEFAMDHNKDLNINIFFEQKKKLINYIKPFVFDPLLDDTIINKGEELYKKCGMTFKAGLLFYGEPGCGKTTTIKGILKYTNRNAIIVDLGKVKTCEELEAIFRTRHINGKAFTGKELCFILEDCDAFDSKVIKRRIENCTPLQPAELKSDVTKLMDKISATTMSVTDTDSLNLACLLNLLDGIIELNGIMIIMTTNHPEKIDPALIRPGRFDFKCEFKKASRETIKEMLKLKYNLTDESLLKYSTDLNNIKDYIMSPAQIQSICFKNERVEECISEIILESQT
jgi:hypothetical protein